MVTCFFCKKEVAPATGTMFVKKDGKILNFCTMKCEKNLLKLKRNPRHTKWSGAYEREKND